MADPPGSFSKKEMLHKILFLTRNVNELSGPQPRCSLFRKRKTHLIVGFNLPDEDREVLDAQHGVIVHLLVCSLHCGFGISARKKGKVI